MALEHTYLELTSKTNLTPHQQELVVYLHQTSVTTRVRERVEDGINPPHTIEIQDRINLISFVDSTNRHKRFAGVEHLIHPENPLQPVYVSLRGLNETGVRMVAKVMSEIDLGPANPDVVTGIPNAGIKIMQEYAAIKNLPYTDVLEKDSTGKIIKKADIPNGEHKRLLEGDDLISTGLSKIPAICAAGEAGYWVESVLVLMDRRKFSAPSHPFYRLFSAFHLIEAVHFLVTQDLIPASTFYEVRKYFSRN